MPKLYICTFDNNVSPCHVGGIQRRIYAENAEKACEFFRELCFSNVRAQEIKDPKNDYLEVLMVNDERFPMGRFQE